MAKGKEKDNGVEIPIEGDTPEEKEDNKADENVDAGFGDESGDSEAAEDKPEETETPEGTEGDSVDSDSSESERSTSKGDSDDPWETKYMRLMADFQNYKKRTAKEVQDIRSSASEKVVTGVLDVLDNFERAFEQGCTDEKFAEGMDNIFKQLQGVLSQSGLEEMQVMGEEFDPNFHNAAVMEETDEFESGKISGVIQKGYTLNGKVIRPPMVKVAK